MNYLKAEVSDAFLQILVHSKYVNYILKVPEFEEMHMTLLLSDKSDWCPVLCSEKLSLSVCNTILVSLIVCCNHFLFL